MKYNKKIECEVCEGEIDLDKDSYVGCTCWKCYEKSEIARKRIQIKRAGKLIWGKK